MSDNVIPAFGREPVSREEAIAESHRLAKTLAKLPEDNWDSVLDRAVSIFDHFTDDEKAKHRAYLEALTKMYAGEVRLKQLRAARNDLVAFRDEIRANYYGKPRLVETQTTYPPLDGTHEGPTQNGESAMALDVKKEFGTDKVAEENGKRIQLDEDTWIVLRRFSCKKSERVRKRLEKPYGKLAPIPEAAMETILTRQIAEGVIVDWGGIEEDGESLAYDVETAVRIMTDYPDLRERFFRLSVDMETFKAEDDAGAAKKSKPRSAGN